MIYRLNQCKCIGDTETANGLDYPLPYDLGYKIVDNKGNVLESRSFAIYEIYVQQKEMMASSYYADKIPNYEAEIKAGTRKLVRLATARRIILQDMKKYNFNTIYAYNMNFDRRALNNDMAFTTENKYRYFFPYGTQYRCIWHMACQVLLARPSFIKFALANGYVSEKGNILTNAEVCYRYITKNVDFVEKHQGIDDVNIETEILFACLRQHKKMNTAPYQACWRLVQNRRKEMELAR